MLARAVEQDEHGVRRAAGQPEPAAGQRPRDDENHRRDRQRAQERG